MTIEIIRYRIPDEHKKSFIQAYQDAGKYLEESPNCLGFEIIQGVEEPERFIVRIHWDSLDGHLQSFRQSPQFQAFFQHVRPFFQSIEEMKHYEQINIHSTFKK
ncbi:Heme-degrading monooxygenase HmoA [Seinonella peptonophila]|uniref:Heme-degrading monooxygenase HmoA n=1 Tax=Seinonella peptonophila TaxID=112248 RepID=A0A1M4U9S4_9BACL|nr:antibiotic biosynthesis monooxygenase family protein [Seinonella peptonophila]SHE53408.1 Heme-degrading monooxygenase HmoA [Seinonella peptonophila]